jgi:hypothetical protein
MPVLKTPFSGLIGEPKYYWTDCDRICHLKVTFSNEQIDVFGSSEALTTVERACAPASLPEAVLRIAMLPVQPLLLVATL